MNGYTKISTKNSHKPRSIDFSDSYSFPPPPPPQTPKPHQEQHVKREKQGNEGGFNNNGAERFGVILGRSGSVSSSSSASGFLQGTVKRAFSMRRSSSVSERYCRIHDQYMAIASPPLANIADHEIIDDDVNNGIRTTKRRSIKKNKIRGGKIFKACKRLLGL